jgi:hypothetical protein
LVFARQQAARYQWLAEKDSGSVQNAQRYTPQLRQQEAAVASAQAALKLDLAQRGTQYRRLNRHFPSFQRACPSRAVPSKPARRERDPVERPVSGHASARDELFRGPGQPKSSGTRTADADAGVVLAYMDAFWVLALISLAAVPLALALRKVKLGGPAPAGH